MPGEQPGAHARAGLADLDEKAPGGVAVAGRRQLDLAGGRIAVEQGADQLERDRLAGVDLLLQRVAGERPAEEQAPLRARRRDIGEPRLLLGVALGRQLGEVLVVVQALGRAAEAPELDSDPGQLAALGPSSPGRTRSGDQPSWSFRPRSATATTSNSRPFAPCTVITRTPA